MRVSVNGITGGVHTMHATTVAIDLAKDVFELAYADPAGRILERKRLTRRAFSRVMENCPQLVVVM